MTVASRLHRSFAHVFHLDSRGTTVRRELTTGITTFLSMSYIFVIHPAILATVGFGARPVLVATILVSTLSTCFSGIWSDLPFVFSPGLEMSIYVAFVAVPVLHISVPQALIAVMTVGIMISLLGFKRIKHFVIDRVPHHFPNAVAVTMSVFLMVVSGILIGVIDYSKGYLTFTGRLDNTLAWSGLGGVLVIILFEVLRVKPSVLFTIVLIAALTRNQHATPVSSDKWLHNFLGSMTATDLFSWITSLNMWQVVFTLFVLSCYGSFSKVINLTKGTSIPEHGAIPRLRRLLVADGISGIAAGLMGTTTVTTFVESGIGIAAGARTGLSAVVAGCLMVSAMLLLPLIQYIPLSSAVGALLYVGILFIPKDRESGKVFSRKEGVVVLLMAFIVITTLSLSIAFALGLIGFFVCELEKEEALETTYVEP